MFYIDGRADSSEPSTSKTPDPCVSTEQKKKKRTRRPRLKKKKDKNNGAIKCSTGTNFEPNFIISNVPQQNGIFYRSRDKTTGPINLKSFVKNGTIPCIFCTGLCNPEILNRIRTLNLNGMTLPSHTVPSASSQVEADQKRKRKKQPAFPDYLTEEEVENGLKNGNFIKGNIRINPKNMKESYVGNEDVSKADYIITSVLDRNRAFEGDEVVLRLKDVNDEKKKVMEVVYITQKVHPRTAVGFLTSLEKNKEYALFTPRDRRIPTMKIPKISWPSNFESTPELYSDILFVAKIIDWREVRYAVGSITENLGLNGDLKVESLAILREFCLDPTPFGDDIQQFLPKTDKIPEEEYDYRRDLRSECIFTIDPLTARDLDDAVSCKRLPNGNYEVGVHISDASFYLKENTKLDKMVMEKATTIYMVDSVYHMLPSEMCLQCSLLPGDDKLTFSVIWEMTSRGEIVSYNIARSLINSCAQLAYEHAQSMIDGDGAGVDFPKVHNGYTIDDLSAKVGDLQKIAAFLREKRRRNGSLKIDQVKIGFGLDAKTGEPREFRMQEYKEANRLIEEFMLLANITVAEHINEKFPDLAFLRMHESPKPTMLIELQKNLETIGFHIDITSSGGIQSSLDKYYSDDFLGRARMIVLNHLLAKPMKRARYFCAGAPQTDDVVYTHYALSVPIYTHFTSPIRRYADIMVHRLLAASLGYCEKPKWNPEDVAVIAETCNRQKYHAKKAGEASADLYLAHFIEKNGPFVQDAVVVDTKERSIDVIVLKTGSVVRIYTNNFGDDVTWKSEEIRIQRDADDESNSKKMWKICVKFPETQSEQAAFMVLEIFTPVRVELTRKPKSNKLEAKLLRPIQVTLL